MLPSCAIVGAGRLGSALAAALPGSTGPFGRGADPRDADVVLLCVPDKEIGTAAAAIEPGPIVGHCSGATTLRPLLYAGHEALSMHRPTSRARGRRWRARPNARFTPPA
jgi:hypothetical protein